MRNASIIGGLSLLVACGSSSSGPTCGDGTALENGMCVTTGTGGVFAADGAGGDNLDIGFSGGDVYLIDPFAGLWFDLGPMVDTDLNLWGVSGISFDRTGKLWGVSTGDSQGDVATGAQLVSLSFG